MSEQNTKIQSLRYKELSLYFDEKSGAYLFQVLDENDGGSDGDLNIENDEYMFEMFKVLNEANNKGLFDKFKKDVEGIDKTIYV